MKKNRKYPVDFKYPWMNKNIISIKIPENYKIKHLPENMRMEMSDNLGGYSFLIKQNGNMIQVSEDFNVNYQIVPTSYYQELRAVYSKMLAKNNEKIVLEKI